jgi:hypothetical protein
MSKQNKLVNKVKHLLKKAHVPRFLHYYGPKIYELWQHVFALFVRSYCQLSYRRVAFFLRGVGFKVATKSTLQRYAAKLRLPFWQTILNLTLGRRIKIGVIDATGLERTKASRHYIKRIDGYRAKPGFYLSLLSTKNKVISLRLRAKKAHDSRDVRYLWNQSKHKPRIMLMDKGYDAEWIHEFFNDEQVYSVAPLRKGAKRGRFRKKLMSNFPKKLYNKRSYGESVFHAFKQKFGASVSSRLIGPARTEVYCRAILHNFFLLISQVLGQTRKFQLELK